MIQFYRRSAGIEKAAEMVPARFNPLSPALA
jgi:hypothetical protein